MQKRVVIALVLFVTGLLIWVPGGDVVKLIINNDEIVFGRYSRGHFGTLFIVTLLLWIAAGITTALRRKPLAEIIFAVAMVYLSTGLSAFVLLIGSSFISKPRYVEEKVAVVDKTAGIAVSGVVRHRPPNERYNLIQKDEPEQLRSYPHAPKGYPEFPLVLTTDDKGFRNAGQRDQYDMVAVGDSFVAGSHVSDDQAWVAMLQQRLGQSIYNLGVSGSDLGVYLNNFVSLGRPLKPKTVMVMVYEGNDFRDVPSVARVVTPAEHSVADAADKQEDSDSGATDEQDENPVATKKSGIAYLAKASPVTKGLKRLSAEVLSEIGKDWPVPDYQAQMGWMPLAVDTPKGTKFYSFTPKKLVYINYSHEQLMQSKDWSNARSILDTFAELSRKDGFRLVIVYAPSAPHVVMPLVQERIPADQLLQFVRYKDKKLDKNADAEAFKRDVFARLDVQEQEVMAWCTAKQVECVSTTAALRQAAAEGRQVYFTYDQHWTPEGNAVVAEQLTTYFQQNP